MKKRVRLLSGALVIGEKTYERGDVVEITAAEIQRMDLHCEAAGEVAPPFVNSAPLAVEK